MKRLARHAAAAAALICAVGAAAPVGTAGTTPDHALQVTINGKPQTSSGPQVSAELLYDGSDQWILTVTNSAKNPDGEDITAIDGGMIGACDPQKDTRQPSAVRDADCALPGVTRITKAKVGTTGGSASFAYAAPHARTYVCELLSNKRVVSRTSCSSAHGYRRLRGGTYLFVVWAVNRAGIAKKATVYGFRIR